MTEYNIYARIGELAGRTYYTWLVEKEGIPFSFENGRGGGGYIIQDEKPQLEGRMPITKISLDDAVQKMVEEINVAINEEDNVKFHVGNPTFENGNAYVDTIGLKEIIDKYI